MFDLLALCVVASLPFGGAVVVLGNLIGRVRVRINRHRRIRRICREYG